MRHLLHIITISIYYAVKAIMFSLRVLVCVPLTIIIFLIAFVSETLKDFTVEIASLAERLVVHKPIAFTFKGAVKAWRKRLEDYRDMADHDLKKRAKRNLSHFKEGSPMHKDAKAYLFAFDKAHADVIKELDEPCEFDFSEEEN